MALDIGRHHSWTVINQKVVRKQCDPSSFDYGVSEIVKAIWEYWDIYAKKPKRDWRVTLNFNGVVEKVKVEVQELGHGRLYYSSEMKKYLKRYDQEAHDVTFTFEKLRSKEYNVTANVRLKRIIADDDLIETEVEKDIDGRPEGKIKIYYTTTYERIPKYKEAAIRANKGYTCKCCGFDFEKKYGELGKNFIEVHHVVPLASRKECIVPDVDNDLVCLCPNCHRMIHRKKENGEIYKVEELQKIINEAEIIGTKE